MDCPSREMCGKLELKGPTSVKSNYKLQKKIGMAGSKSTPTRLVGILTDKMHPTTFFKQHGFYEKACRDAFCMLSLPVLLVYF